MTEMKKLKGVVFSLRGVLESEGNVGGEMFSEVVKLIQFLKSKEVEPVIVSNGSWTMKETKTPFAEYLAEKVGFEVDHFEGGKDGMPYKQRGGAMPFIAKAKGWETSEMLYVGNTREDMIAASSGGLMFLNAKWHEDNNPHGFEFSSPLDMARFIDCCCLSVGEWFWAHEEDNLRVFSIAPFAEYSRRFSAGKAYSSDAKQALKSDGGDLSFWGRLMAARLYFSGLAKEANYTAPYPGHSTESEKRLLLGSVKILSGSMRANYLEDFIVRHTDAQKSQTLRRQKIEPDHQNQLSTICLRRDPKKTGPKGGRYKNPPSLREKTILLIDDICTQGHSLEAARVFVEKMGAKAICVTWLKTPGGNHYRRLESLSPELKKAYEPYSPEEVEFSSVSLNQGIRNSHADEEVAKSFLRYRDWTWPSGQ